MQDASVASHRKSAPSNRKNDGRTRSPVHDINGAAEERLFARRRHRKWRIDPYLLIVHGTGPSGVARGGTISAASAEQMDLCVQLSGTKARGPHAEEVERPLSNVVKMVVDGPAKASSGGSPRVDLVTLLIHEGDDPILDAAITAHGSGGLVGPRGTFVGAVLLTFADHLPYATGHDASLLAEALRCILLTSLGASSSGGATDEAASDARLRSRVEAIIAAHIASARLDAGRIAQLAGISRATLYRLFDGSGGVASHLRRLRLERIRADLCNPAQCSIPIAELAERHGLYNAASFNRTFRRVYGVTPREMRAGMVHLSLVNRQPERKYAHEIINS